MSEETILEPGERLLWSGQPDALAFVVAQGWLGPSIPPLFGIVLGSVVLAHFEHAVEGTLGEKLGIVVGSLVCLILFLLPVQTWTGAKRLRYVLTDRRAIVWGPSLDDRKIFELRHVPSVSVHVLWQGVANIVLSQTWVDGGEHVDGGDLGAWQYEGFLAVRRFWVVEDIVRAAVHDAKGTS